VDTLHRFVECIGHAPVRVLRTPTKPACALRAHARNLPHPGASA